MKSKYFYKILLLLCVSITSVSCSSSRDEDPRLTVSETSVSFEPEGGTIKITISANNVWKIANIPNWLQLNQTSGNAGETVITVTAAANNLALTRSMTLIVNSDNGQSRRVKCSQLNYENLPEKFANVSPKLMSGNANPLLDFMFTADPTAIEYNGRVYVYATNDHQQFEKVGKDGKNHYGFIRSLVIMSSDDMVNWTYHGLINTAVVAPWTGVSWAPSIASRPEADGKTHFYLYFSNGATSAVLTSTSPVGPWTDPLGKNIVDHSVPGVDVEVPFDPGVVIDDQGTGWLVFGAGTPKTRFMPGNARIVKLGADMISLASNFSEIPAPYFNEASDLNFINGTWVYSYCTDWAERTVWPFDNIPKPTACCISYMTSKTPLDRDSWKYRDNYFKLPGDVGVGPVANNHSHMFKFKEKYYLTYHAMYLQDYFNTTGGFRNVGIEEMQVDEGNGVNIPMVKATYKGTSQIKPLDPFVLQQAETTAATSGKVQFEAVGNLGNMVAKGTVDSQCVMVRGADFSKQIPTGFEAKVKGKGRIDIYVNTLKSSPLFSLTCDVKDWTTLSKKIDLKIDKGVVNIYFAFRGEGFLFDEWKFTY